MTRNVHLLLIEDETILAKNIRAYLVRNGYEVRIAITAEVGLAELKAFKPDIILLDFNLPGMNGLEALPKIHPLDSQVKVIMMTGDAGIDLAGKAMYAGATDFVAIPFSFGDLRLKLEGVFINACREKSLS